MWKKPQKDEHVLDSGLSNHLSLLRFMQKHLMLLLFQQLTVDKDCLFAAVLFPTAYWG